MLMVMLMVMLAVLMFMVLLMLMLMPMLNLMLVVLVVEVMVIMMVDILEKQNMRRKLGTEKFWKNGAIRNSWGCDKSKISLDSGKTGTSKQLQHNHNFINVHIR